MTNIVLINETSVLTDEEVAAVVPVIQTLFEQFEAVWNTGLKVTVATAPAMVADPAAWPIYLMDTTDVPGAGGYHDDTGPTPSGKVFVKDAMDAGEAWTVDLSHEMLEMCSDPTTDVIVPLPNGEACLREVCDAVEADQFGYKIGNVLVSDWCTPEYFRQTGDNAPAADSGSDVMARGMYDYMDHLKAPAPALLDGGYLGIRDSDGNWSIRSDFVGNSGQMSRRARRTMGRLNRAARRG